MFAQRFQRRVAGRHSHFSLVGMILERGSAKSGRRLQHVLVVVVRPLPVTATRLTETPRETKVVLGVENFHHHHTHSFRPTVETEH